MEESLSLLGFDIEIKKTVIIASCISALVFNVAKQSAVLSDHAVISAADVANYKSMRLSMESDRHAYCFYNCKSVL